MAGRITDSAVDALPPGRELRDGALPGFVARRQRRDAFYSVTWSLRGRRGRTPLGRHGPKTGGLTAAKARKLAIQVLGQVKAGKVPGETTNATLPILVELAERWLLQEVAPRRKPRTIEEYRRNLKRLILPKLGALRVDAIGKTDVTAWHSGLSGVKVAANRSLDVLSGMLRFAEQVGLRPEGSNPCRFIKPYPERPCERRLTPIELARLGAAIRQAAVGFEGEDVRRVWEERCGADAEAADIAPDQRDAWVAARAPRRLTPEDPRLVALIRVLFFTGARRDEIRTAQWSWLDPVRGVLRLPDSKTGAKTIQIPPPALDVLADLPRLSGNPYIFWGDREGRPLTNIKDPWCRIRALAALPGLRLHDLRHTFASVAAANGDSLLLIGQMLGHRQASTTQRYAHLFSDEVKAAAHRTGSAIYGLMGGAELYAG
jgi:integrase